MIIGIPKEIKGDETRVSILPSGVETLVSNGHRVIIEKDAGRASGNLDEEYIKAGGEIVSDITKVYEEAELLFKIKPLIPEEYKYIREGQIFFGYYQTQNRPELTQVLLDKNIIVYSYERTKDERGNYPLLAPMSAIAGQVSAILGAYHLFNTQGGNGLLIGGFPGVETPKVTILGAGNSGLAALKYMAGLGADITLLDRNVHKLQKAEEDFPRIETLITNESNIKKILCRTDLLINSIRLRGDTHLVTRDMLKLMKSNSLIVNADGMDYGAIETARQSHHEEPVYVVDGIRHISIDNYPNAVTNTATKAFANAAIPYILEVANKGWIKATEENIGLRNGLTVAKGHFTFKEAAEFHDIEYTSVDRVIELLK